MGSWNEILNEIKDAVARHGTQGRDIVRRKYLNQLFEVTNRNTIQYLSRWPLPSPEGSSLMIDVADIQGFMAAIHGLKGSELDIILHTPGGSPEATESIVTYLREKFDHIRFFIPHAAMSAGTMLALSGNEILMGKHSFLGPIDPQVLLDTPLGRRMLPAQAILDQFELAKRELHQDSRNYTSWAPILPQYGPALLTTCANSTALAEELVRKWAEKYHLADEADARERAKKIVDDLLDHSKSLSHGRMLSRRKFEACGLKITHFEDDQDLQEAILSVFHAGRITFEQSTTFKIIENHVGRGQFSVAHIEPMGVENSPKKMGRNPKKRRRK